MTALTTGLGGQERATWGRMTWILTGAKVYQGSKVGMIRVGADLGKITKFTAASNLLYLGQVYLGGPNSSLDATSADKACQVDMPREITGLKWMPQGATPVLAANLLQLVYMADDNTVVPGTADLGVSPAGRAFAVDSTRVLVYEAGLDLMFRDTPTPGPVFAFTAGDYAPAAIVHGATYLVPAPSAASAMTVTLPAPAALPDGLWAEFIADGTTNTQTTQYRDATGPVNLTAALTASKRHRVRVEVRGGKWTLPAAAWVAP